MLTRSSSPENHLLGFETPSKQIQTRPKSNKSLNTIPHLPARHDIYSHRETNQFISPVSNGKTNGKSPPNSSASPNAVANLTSSTEYFKLKQTKPQISPVPISLNNKGPSSTVSRSPPKGGPLKTSTESPKGTTLGSAQNQLRTLVGLVGSGRKNSKQKMTQVTNNSHLAEEKSVLSEHLTTQDLNESSPQRDKTKEETQKIMNSALMANQLRKAERIFGKSAVNKWSHRQNLTGAFFRNDSLNDSKKLKEGSTMNGNNNQIGSQMQNGKNLAVPNKGNESHGHSAYQGSPIMPGKETEKALLSKLGKEIAPKEPSHLSPGQEKKSIFNFQQDINHLSNCLVAGNGLSNRSKGPLTKKTGIEKKSIGVPSSVQQRPGTGRTFQKDHQTPKIFTSSKDTNSLRNVKAPSPLIKQKSALEGTSAVTPNIKRDMSSAQVQDNLSKSAAYKLQNKASNDLANSDSNQSQILVNESSQSPQKENMGSNGALRASTHPQRDRNQVLYPKTTKEQRDDSGSSNQRKERDPVEEIKETEKTKENDFERVYKEKEKNKKAGFVSQLSLLLDAFWRTSLVAENSEVIREKLFEVISCLISFQEIESLEKDLKSCVSLFTFVAFLVFDMKKKKKQATNKTTMVITKVLESLKRELHHAFEGSSNQTSAPKHISLLLEQMYSSFLSKSSISICASKNRLGPGDKELKEILSFAESISPDVFLANMLQIFFNKGILKESFLARIVEGQTQDSAPFPHSQKPLETQNAANTTKSSHPASQLPPRSPHPQPPNSVYHQALQNKSHQKEPTSPPQTTCLLPKLRPDRLYSLVLDLDETLIHYEERGDKGEFLIRPYAQEFIDELAKYYEITVFTASVKEYADWILDRLDTNASITHRLYRHHTTTLEEGYTKNLKDLGREMSKILIVDNNPENFKFQPENGVYIKSWFQDPKDKALYDLCPLLREIVVQKSSDVRLALNIFRDQMLENIRKGATSPHANLSLKRDKRFQPEL